MPTYISTVFYPNMESPSLSNSHSFIVIDLIIISFWVTKRNKLSTFPKFTVFSLHCPLCWSQYIDQNYMFSLKIQLFIGKTYNKLQYKPICIENLVLGEKKVFSTLFLVYLSHPVYLACALRRKS